MHVRARRVRIALMLAAGLIAALTVRPAPAEHVHGGPDYFVTVSDGTSIAVQVVFPDSYDPANPGAIQYPTIYEMAGYENGSSSDEGRTFLGETEDHCRDMGIPCQGFPLTGDSHEGTSAFRYDADYVSVHASLRGTGCSSGEFNLFSTRGALDGVEVIENWLVKQPWSNGKVGILGHSYSGNTGFMIAAMYNSPQWTGEQHLVAMTVSGMIDDVYRGITYPGGVSNYLFPPLWSLAIRNAYDVAGGSAQALVRHMPDEIAQQCLRNIATHRRTVVEDPLLNGINDTDGEWWHARSNIYYASDIDVPTHFTGAFQDEQTGPRFAHLWEGIPAGVPKRLVMLNGNHGSQVGPTEAWSDRKAWMDYWMRGIAHPNVDITAQPVSVRTLFEMHDGGDGLVSNGFKESTAFPLPDTAWTPFFLGADGALSATPTAAGSAMYLSGTKRQSWFYDAGPGVGPPVTTMQAPDELDFVSTPFGSDTAMAGPITANLFLASSAPDTDVFVQVTDRDADGNVSWLTRGILKASHRAINLGASDYAGQDPLNPSEPFLYRPWRPHTNPTTIAPLEVNEYLIEIWPVAHIFRAGHSLQIKIMAPPAVDSYYSYAPRTAPPIALNTVHFGGETPSRVTIPIVGLPALGAPLACGEVHQVRCFPD